LAHQTEGRAAINIQYVVLPQRRYFCIAAGAHDAASAVIRLWSADLRETLPDDLYEDIDLPDVSKGIRRQARLGFSLELRLKKVLGILVDLATAPGYSQLKDEMGAVRENNLYRHNLRI